MPAGFRARASLLHKFDYSVMLKYPLQLITCVPFSLGCGEEIREFVKMAKSLINP
jgi:hypothetical protein